MRVDLKKKLKSEKAVVVDSESLSCVFDFWVGFTEIDVDLLRFGWTWRRSRVSCRLRLVYWFTEAVITFW